MMKFDSEPNSLPPIRATRPSWMPVPGHRDGRAPSTIDIDILAISKHLSDFST